MSQLRQFAIGHHFSAVPFESPPTTASQLKPESSLAIEVQAINTFSAADKIRCDRHHSLTIPSGQCARLLGNHPQGSIASHRNRFDLPSAYLLNPGNRLKTLSV